MKSKSTKLVVLTAISLGVFSQFADADETCGPQWQHAIGQPGMSHQVQATTVYNGDLFAGGWFTTAGGQTVNRIARWDGGEWHPLISGGHIGMSGTVHALTVYNGDLIAGGSFTTAGGETVNRIARWDGAQWHPFTSGGQIGVDNNVVSLTVHNGDLIVGGQFITAGGSTVNHIARWDGVQWQRFLSGGIRGVSSAVRSLTVYNGDLVVGGIFATAGGQTVNYIARWDGVTWHPFTSGGQVGVSAGGIRGMTVYGGDLIVGGAFTTAGSEAMNRIARWDGAQWIGMGSGSEFGFSHEVESLMVFNGDLIAGGWFLSTAGGQAMNNIARWDGSLWHPLTSGGEIGTNSIVFALTEYDSDLIAAGNFSTAGGQIANRIAAWRDRQRGACCINGAAVQLYEGECVAVGGVFMGEGVPSDEVTCPPTCAADINSDGVVDVSDLLQLLGQWGMCP